VPIPSSLMLAVDRQLTKYCAAKIPADLADKVRLTYETKGTAITLIEERPGFDHPEVWVGTPIARFRYNLEAGLWMLYWADRNLKWHRYEGVGPARTLGPLLREVDEDPTGIFWG